jgi:protein-tyrosine phosphatase
VFFALALVAYSMHGVGVSLAVCHIQVQANRLCLPRVSQGEAAGQLRPLIDALVAGHSVLVYCLQGKNRSVLIVTMILSAWLGVQGAKRHVQYLRKLS